MAEPTINIQNRMDELVKSYIEFCILMESKFENITALAYNDELKTLEAIAESYYKNNNITEFIIVVNTMRAHWNEKSNQYVQQEMTWK